MENECSFLLEKLPFLTDLLESKLILFPKLERMKIGFDNNTITNYEDTVSYTMFN